MHWLSLHRNFGCFRTNEDPGHHLFFVKPLSILATHLWMMVYANKTVSPEIVGIIKE